MMAPHFLIHRIRPEYPRWMTQDRLRKLRTDFRAHRGSAQARGIEFHLSFSEWLSIWLASGKLLRRGRLRGQYVMARHNDRGTYVARNVSIILATENISIARRGKPGKPHTAETRFILSLSAQLQWGARRDAAQAEARP